MVWLLIVEPDHRGSNPQLDKCAHIFFRFVSGFNRYRFFGRRRPLDNEVSIVINIKICQFNLLELPIG